MSGLIKLLLILGLVTFSSYTFYVEPNAANDPAGAVSRAVDRLSTFCDRNQEECAFLSDFGEGIGHVSSIAWKLVTGEGRLVYVANDPCSQPNWSSHHRDQTTGTSGRSLGDLIRSTGLLSDGHSDNNDGTRDRSRHARGFEANQRYSYDCN